MSHKKAKFAAEIEALSHEDLKREYARLLASRSSLQQENARIKKWAQRATEATTMLATEAATAFQAMAEKAGVRNHPSVTATVQLFDAIMHPQWHNEDHEFPKVEFPADWNFDPPEPAWSGDADMSLNSPIADAVEFLESLKFGGKPKIEHVFEIMEKLHRVGHRGVEGVKKGAGFKPLHFGPLPAKHYRDMDADELRQMLETASWMALDLAQDMGFANEVLRRDLRASTYRRVCSDLYRMSQWTMEPHEDAVIDIKVMGGEQRIV